MPSRSHRELAVFQTPTAATGVKARTGEAAAVAAGGRRQRVLCNPIAHMAYAMLFRGLGTGFPRQPDDAHNRYARPDPPRGDRPALGLARGASVHAGAPR